MGPIGVDQPLMTLRQAAARTRLSATTLRRYIKSGRLKARLIPGRYGPEYVVDEEALRAAGCFEETNAGEVEASNQGEGPRELRPLEAHAPAHAERGREFVSQRTPSPPATAAGGEGVPLTLYRELMMKHEQLLVQYGALRVSGRQLYEVRQEAERRAEEARRALEDLERVRNRHAREIGELKARLRQAQLDLAERDAEIERLAKELERRREPAPPPPSHEGIETRFLRALRGGPLREAPDS